MADQTQANSRPAPHGRWYPEMPPAHDGETDEAYTNRLLGVGQPSPYDHPRNRQCSIGWHDECSDRSGGRCLCPCHPLGIRATAGLADPAEFERRVSAAFLELVNHGGFPHVAEGTAREIVRVMLEAADVPGLLHELATVAATLVDADRQAREKIGELERRLAESGKKEENS